MDFESLSGYNLRGLARKNVVLGKNGCGKSRLLKLTEQALRGRPDMGAVRYLSPERGGILQYEAGIEQNLTSNATWLAETRRQNQAGQFRQQSAAQFSRLERRILREIERTPQLRDDHSVTFDLTVDKINTLLDRVFLTRDDPAFRITDKATGTRAQPQDISSGESELVSLGIECLAFEKECHAGKFNLLLIDEPDVHLHPDLQARLARFLHELVAAGDFCVLIATHSTALLSALSECGDTHLAFMRFGDTDLQFAPVSDVHRRVLPVFGAHPLSNVFNQAPVLLVEGEDDERVWQQAVRSSGGRIKLYPCAVDGVGQLKPFEEEVASILAAVYDAASGYSLRDLDDDPSEIDDVVSVKRMRLGCREAENLLLADEVLAALGVTWDQLRSRIDGWLASNAEHPHHAAMKAFAGAGHDRRKGNLKPIRNDLVGLMGSNKPWEVIVGQALAALTTHTTNPSSTSLVTFLGPKACQYLLRLAPAAEGAEAATLAPTGNERLALVTGGEPSPSAGAPRLN